MTFRKSRPIVVLSTSEYTCLLNQQAPLWFDLGTLVVEISVPLIVIHPPSFIPLNPEELSKSIG